MSFMFESQFSSGPFTLLTEHYDMEQEEQATFLSPAEDKDSKEVFSLIKKLNIVPDTRKKTKTSGKIHLYCPQLVEL